MDKKKIIIGVVSLVALSALGYFLWKKGEDKKKKEGIPAENDKPSTKGGVSEKGSGVNPDTSTKNIAISDKDTKKEAVKEAPSDPKAPSNVGSPVAVKTAKKAKTYLITSAGDKYPVANQSDFKKITGHNTWDYKINILSDAEISIMKTVKTFS